MSLAEGYQVIRNGAAIGSVAARRQLSVTGGDRGTYLHGLLTNDIQALGPGTGCYSAWLTPQGRMHTDLHVLAAGDLILLDVPAAQADATLERLEQFIFSEDVAVESLDGRTTVIWVHGPAAADAVERSLEGLDDPGSWPAYRVSQATIADAPALVVRIDQLGVPGYGIYVHPDVEQSVRAALRGAGSVEVSAEAIEAARIEAGYPVFGVDMTGDTIPLEAGIEPRAISFTKGCYPGQEVIIRVLHRGGGRVAKRLVGLRLDGSPPPAHAKVFAGEREVGFVTSAAASPAGGAVALGYVHRDFVEAGTPVQVQVGDARAPAVVKGPVGREPHQG